MTCNEPVNTATSLAGARDVFERLAVWGEARSWIGGDPYEGLNAVVGRAAPGIRGRQAVIQLYKRLPFSPPWPLAAAPRPNAKALALVLSAYSTAAAEALPDRDATAADLVERLGRMRLRSGESWGWGYPFDVQTRHLRYSETAPNAVATCFVVEALLEHARREPASGAAALAIGSRPFLRSLLHRSAEGPYFGYVPERSKLIHNANLLVCGTLARLHDLEPAEATAEVATEAAQTTIRAQDERGLWAYGVGSNLGWADNFHTAYVLDGLHATAATFGVGAEALGAGLAAWRTEFFDERAGALLYPGSPYPLEAHSFASAIDLCCTARDLDPGLIDFGRRIAERAIELLWMPEAGRFAYRVTRLGRNRREFMRWTNAPMLRALARLLTAIP